MQAYVVMWCERRMLFYLNFLLRSFSPFINNFSFVFPLYDSYKLHMYEQHLLFSNARLGKGFLANFTRILMKRAKLQYWRPIFELGAKLAKKYFFFLVFGPNMALVMFIWNIDSFKIVFVKDTFEREKCISERYFLTKF